MQKRDFLTLQDYSKEEIWELLETTRRLKGKLVEDEEATKLKGKSVVLLFQKSSTRTRASFEVGVTQLGGHALYFGWQESQLGRGETIADTARVLSRYVDGVVARVYKQMDLEEMARHASVPVINALSDLYHPCQIVADLYTIWEKRGSLEGLKIAYVGDGNNVCNSLLIGCSKMGVNISVACPAGYEPFSKAVESARKNSYATGSTVEILRDPVKAVGAADVIYTDTFVSMGDEAEREERLKAFLPRYQVTSDLFRHAAEDAIFMHCLPAHRQEEVTDEVIDGLRSVVWDEAENRLHTAKAILAKTIA
ncbi:MAG: ornithine carbamoyltransferase [Candidatus Bathyarchaeota archaeon]|nr:ornithine carbamoyltransferase [Candidatus Bathyarchaeota archaeon]